MGAQGTATVNFGSFPGSAMAEVAVTGQTAISGTSLVEAWIYPPGGTADHSEDEHTVENFRVTVFNLIAATGFSIRAEVTLPGGFIYGQWQIAWVWN